MKQPITSLQQAIESTLVAIVEGRDQVESIARSTMDEVVRLEAEHEELKTQCYEAIDRVEWLERESRRARERLLVVNRDINRFSESEMKQAYENAQTLQIELGQWREREAQLRFRRDDIARRLRSLRSTANQAELLMLKFQHVSQYLTADFSDLAETLQTAQIQSLLGIQLLQMQEEERGWLANKLHDGPMQSLASVAMRMQAVNAEPVTAFDDIRQRLNHIIVQLRQVVFDLRPPLLEDLGLVPTLKRYAQQFSDATGLTIRIQLVGIEYNLSPTEKVTVFRSVQEALRNAAKHSAANEIDLTLTYGEQSLKVDVLDDGTGMGEVDWLAWVEAGKLGLMLCKQRLGVLGGSMELTHRVPRGTQFSAQLPILRG